MSLKDNFNQAVKEILRRDGLVSDKDKDKDKEQKKKSELEKYLEPPKAEPSMPLAEALLAQAEKERVERDDSPYVMSPENAQSFGKPAAVQDEPVFEPPPFTAPPRPSITAADFTMPPPPPQSAAPPPPAQAAPPPPFGGVTPPFDGMAPAAVVTGRKSEPSYYETEETTVISRNTVIDGNIRSFANITVDGSVKGDVKLTKNIAVSGKVVGDIECNNSVMTGASMQGNISSKGQVQIDRDSLILGDISAQYLDMNGKIKGNIEVGGKAELKSDAVIFGSITVSTITVLDGATINGFVNTTFLQENTDNIFPEAIAVNE